MEISEFKIGKSIEVDVEREDMIYHHKSKVEAVVDKSVYITPILNKRGDAFNFKEGDKVTFVYRLGERLWRWTDVKAGRALYEGDSLQVLTVRVKEGESFNRREAFRVFFGTNTKVRRRVLDMEKTREYRLSHPEIRNINDLLNIDECYKDVIVQVVLKDVSINGIGLFAQEKLPEQSELSIMIPTEYGIIQAVCTPVRTFVDHEAEYHYFYGCRLLKVSANISRILVSLQRRQMAINRFQKGKPT